MPLHLHPAYADTAEAIDAVIRGYQARIPLRHWSPIEKFVKTAVSDARPETVARARRMLREATGLTHWAVAECGRPKDRDVFDLALVDEYLSSWSGRARPATVDASRAHLIDLVRRLESSPDVIGPGTSNPKALSGVPYSANEQVRIRSWMRARNGRHRISATAIVSLAAGAGLVNQDIIQLTRNHVIDHGPDRGIEISVPGRHRPRTTWCALPWEEDLRWVLAQLTHPGQHLVHVDVPDRKPKHVSQFLNYYNSPHALRITVYRLHATWFVSHLNAGTPINILLSAAGHKTTGQSLLRYVPHMRTFDPATITAYLRQEEPTT